MAGLIKKCCNCRSDLHEINGTATVQCEKCQKNEAKYGKYQISKLNGVISQRDACVLEKDKRQLLKEKEEAVQAVHEKYRLASKQAKK
uniref:RPOL9 domain-containing protein n=1 Tax=Heterorhabditis bacteriophora TaxID=37862 RepID=A0A1I7WTV3_HETBA